MAIGFGVLYLDGWSVHQPRALVRPRRRCTQCDSPSVEANVCDPLHSLATSCVNLRGVHHLAEHHPHDLEWPFLVITR